MKRQNGKVRASWLVWHLISLPRAVNDSLLARISGGRTTQSGRFETPEPVEWQLSKIE
jgi:hypothetical protein